MNDIVSNKYPTDDQIKVEWTIFHKTICVIPTFIIWIWFISGPGLESPFHWNKFLSLLGLNIDIFGVVIASLKPPYFGLFADGGMVEFKRGQAEQESFKKGMFIVAIGLLFQALGVLV